MKRYWLMALSAVLVITLLISPCAPFAASAEETTEVQEAAAPQIDKQIFLLPKINRDYGNKDTERQFEKIIKELLLLLPQDETVQVVLFPPSGDEPKVLKEPEELSEALELPYEVKDSADWLNKIETDYAAQAKQNIVIAMESGNVKNTIEDRWGPLKQLANNGTEVYLIGLETEKNENAGEALASWISDGRLERNSCDDSLVTVAKCLHFAWVRDYNRALETLVPLLEELTGLTFETAAGNEHGVFTFHPYVGLTEEIVVLLENRAQDAYLSVTNGTTKALEHEVIGSGNTLSVIRITEVTDIVKVAGGREATGMIWAPVYGDMNGLKLEFGNSDNRTIFERNQQGNFYAAVPGLDQDILAQTMEHYGASCKLVDGATGRVLQTMNYDAAGKFFRTDYVFTESSENRQLCAQLLLNDRQNACLTSELYTVEVTNTAPEITAQSESVYWIGDPWEEKKTRLTIPLDCLDREKDQVTLKLVEPIAPLLPGLGNVRLSDDQSELIIELNERPLTAETFTIKVTANDGELTSEPYEISFVLYDLTEELQKLQRAGAVELPAGTSIPKYEDFQVAAKVLFPEEMPKTLKQKLTEKIQEQYSCMLQVEGPEGALETIPMEKSEDWLCTGNFQRSGAYQIKALFSTEKETLWIESKPQEITIVGKAPIRANADFPAKLDEMMTRSEESTEESWHMEGLIPSALFTDEDGDEIVISVSANRLNLKEGEQPLKLEAHAVGREEAELRFTVAGLYEVAIAASDVDGEGDIITCMVRVTSARSKIIQYVLLGAAGLLAVVLLVWLVVTLAKPSFKGKLIEVTVRSTYWTKKTVVYADAWKKAAQPVSVLLTCAASPPDNMLYAALEECTIRPHRRGMVLLKGDKLGLEKKTLINANESVSFQVDQYQVELKVTLD